MGEDATPGEDVVLGEGAGGEGGRQGRQWGEGRTPRLDSLGVEGAALGVGKGTARISEGGRATCVGRVWERASHQAGLNPLEFEEGRRRLLF